MVLNSAIKIGLCQVQVFRRKMGYVCMCVCVYVKTTAERLLL